jgi:branched-chain amino acid aminotransferase
MTRVWLNGRIVPLEEACVPVSDRGLLLGDGLFETMPVYNGRVFDLGAHLARLASGLAVLGFAEAVDTQKLRAAIAQFASEGSAAGAILRLTITRGAGPRGLSPPDAPCPTVLMTLAPMPPAGAAPVSLRVAQSTRRNETSPLARIKALPYLDNLLALREAKDHGADDALMLNTKGKLACASIANLFVIKGNHLLTPPAGDGALPGTMRALVLSLARAAGFEPAEASLELKDLAAADGVFLTNCISRITEAKECDGLPLAQLPGAASRLRALIRSRFESE